MAPDPLFGDINDLGPPAESEETPAADTPPAAPPPPAAMEASPPAAAPPPQTAATMPPAAETFGFRAPIGAMPDPPRDRFVPTMLRALSIFGGVTAVGAGVVLAQRTPNDPEVWIFLAAAVVLCVGLYVVAGLGRRPHDPGGPSIVS
jgi:hypothetical protein